MNFWVVPRVSHFDLFVELLGGVVQALEARRTANCELGLDVPHTVAATDAGGWNVTADDRDFIGFSISPRNGRKLRHAVTFGGARVRVESDARRYVGTLPAVTALIPTSRLR